MSTGRDSSSRSGLTISRLTGMTRYAVAVSFRAFFTASSIVPTM